MTHTPNDTDLHLAGITAEQWQLADAATRQVQTDIAEMNAVLDRGMKRADAFFAQIAAIKAA